MPVVQYNAPRRLAQLLSCLIDDGGAAARMNHAKRLSAFTIFYLTPCSAAERFSLIVRRTDSAISELLAREYYLAPSAEWKRIIAIAKIYHFIFVH